MSTVILDPGGGTSGGNKDSDFSAAGQITIPPVQAHRLIGALMLVMRDEINLIRADPLTILASRSVADIVAAVKAKL